MTDEASTMVVVARAALEGAEKRGRITRQGNIT